NVPALDCRAGRASCRGGAGGDDDAAAHGASGILRRAGAAGEGCAMTVPKTDVLGGGAGAYGPSCAWWMGKRRSGARIMVVDQGDFACGASGRNGAGFRMQWGLDLNIRLCQESTEFFETAAEKLDYPRGIELKQDGYLVLAHSEKALAKLKSSVETQHRYGVPSEMLSADDCVAMVPSLGRNRLLGASFC